MYPLGSFPENPTSDAAVTTLDIKPGDILVVGTNEYPIRAVETWTWSGPRLAFKRMTTVTASTKRAPAISGGLRGDPATNIVSLKCTPLDPLSADVQKRVMIQTVYQALQTFVDGTSYLMLIVEDIKR